MINCLKGGKKYMKKFIIPFLAIVMFGSTVAIVPAFAANNNSSSSNWFSGLVQYISQKFGLDQNQIKTAITDYNNQQKQNIEQKILDREKARLDKLVKDGKITSDQEQAI